MEKVFIETDEIQLDQFLKYAGEVMTGGEVKELILEGRITLNGSVETARRRKLRAGDIVEVDNGGGKDVLEVAKRK